MSSGWMSTLKTNADIERAKRQALQHRKTMKQQKLSTFTVSSVPALKKKAKSTPQESIVDDEYFQEELEVDEEDMQVPPTSTFMDEESSEDEEGLLQGFQARPSKSINIHKNMLEKYSKPKPQKKKSTNATAKPKNPYKFIDDVLTSPSPTPKKSSSSSSSSSRYFSQTHQELLSSDEEVFSPPKKAKTWKKRRIEVDSDEEEEDDDFFSKKQQPQQQEISILMDTPEPEQKRKKLKKKSHISKKNSFARFAHSDSLMQQTTNNDDVSDEDERMAIEWAINESKKEMKKVIDIENDEDEPEIDEQVLEETSEEEDDDIDEGEEYDEERQAATSVLHTAEKLSAHVLETMSVWMTGDDGEAASKGMIVDGALSMGTIAGPSLASKQSRHEWISQEKMMEICPHVKLSNYQLIGVNWLSLLHGMKCNIEGKRNTNVNGVLADEMGLGKTVQTITFLAWLRHKHRSNPVNIDVGDEGQEESYQKPHLIVVPVSVLPNWVREFEKFCPELNVVKYHGSMAERESIQDDLRKHLPKNLSAQRNKKWAHHHQQQHYDRPLDVILAPVTYFQKEKSDDRKFLKKFKFDYLVVDEAHMLKNAQSTRYKMLDKISTQHRLLLTGTPVQNSPQELLNMLCFLMPLFGRDESFLDEDGSGAAAVGERMLQHFVEHEKIEEHGDEQMAYKKLKHLFAPFVLRRKKSDVIAQLLPPKERIVEFVHLDPAARAIYDNILAAHVNKSGNKITAAIGDHLFTNLRKAAHHPLLLRTRHTSPKEKEHLVTHFHKYGAFKGEGSTKARVADELEKFNDFNIHLAALDLIDENPHRRNDLDRYILPEEALFSSAKFKRLTMLLPGLIRDGHRVLIFSVWTSCLDLLGCLMEHLGLEYLRMDGSCPADERQELIDDFNSNNSTSIFLLSTKACGLGINLTAADTCIIHDLDFNPFNDLQAEDRCHRIGQKKAVTVYKMVAKDTVDADIYMMQERKSKMNAAIMGKNNNSDKKERREMLQTAVNRFLGSSPGSSAKGGGREIIEII